MLGERLGAEQGRVITRRVLPGDDYRFVKMEITFEAEATLLGVSGIDTGTYTVFERVPGQLYGEGQGIFMTREGEGVIWKGHGIGTPTGDGMGIKFAASVAYQTNSQQLARLNMVLGVVDGDGSVKSEVWEWKV